MTKQSFVVSAALVVAAVASPGIARAQTFKVEKYNIGGDGGTDYIIAEPGTGRVFVSRGTHVMVVDGATGKVLGDIPDTPRMHGIGLAPKSNHGFTTNGGDSTVTMFDLKTLAVHQEDPDQDRRPRRHHVRRLLRPDHPHQPQPAAAPPSRSTPKTGDIVGTVELEDNAPEGAASDGKGKLFVNNEANEHDPGASTRRR